MKFCLILNQLDKIHKGKINVVKTININEILSIPKEKLIFKDSNQVALKSKLRIMADRHLKAKEFINTNEVQKLGLCC